MRTTFVAGLAVPTPRNLATRIPSVNSSSLARNSKVGYHRFPARESDPALQPPARCAPKKVQIAMSGNVVGVGIKLLRRCRLARARRPLGADSDHGDARPPPRIPGRDRRSDPLGWTARPAPDLSKNMDLRGPESAGPSFAISVTWSTLYQKLKRAWSESHWGGAGPFRWPGAGRLIHHISRFACSRNLASAHPVCQTFRPTAGRQRAAKGVTVRGYPHFPSIRPGGFEVGENFPYPPLTLRLRRRIARS